MNMNNYNQDQLALPVFPLFFVFLVRLDASPVICGRPVGHPCTTFPSLGQSGICAMRPPRPAYGIYALCSLHFAASFMQPFFKTTIIFTFASQLFWLASSSFFHFLSIVDHQVKETKLIYCFPKITACSNHKATNLHEVTGTSWPFESSIWIQTSDLLHIRHMVLCFTQGGLCIGWPTALWGTIWCSCELAIRISRG